MTYFGLQLLGAVLLHTFGQGGADDASAATLRGSISQPASTPSGRMSPSMAPPPRDAAEPNVTASGTSEVLGSWWCEPVGGVCGGPWKWPKTCCGNAKCKKLLGGDGTMKCVEQRPEPRCVPSKVDCGGPGRRTERCCGSATCEKLLGGDGTMRCVEHHSEPQCVAPHAECGGPGRRTMPCCGPEFSCKAPHTGAVHHTSAVMKCVRR